MSFLSPNNSTVLGDNQVPWDNNIVVQIICSIHMNWAQLTIFLPFFSNHNTNQKYIITKAIHSFSNHKSLYRTAPCRNRTYN